MFLFTVGSTPLLGEYPFVYCIVYSVPYSKITNVRRSYTSTGVFIFNIYMYHTA
jgi:hypothetical protein